MLRAVVARSLLVSLSAAETCTPSASSAMMMAMTVVLLHDDIVARRVAGMIDRTYSMLLFKLSFASSLSATPKCLKPCS